MTYQHIKLPAMGERIERLSNGQLNVPDVPMIPFIEGDGIGVDVTPAMLKVVDAAVEQAYAGQRKIAWFEIFAGAKAANLYGNQQYLPQETLDALDAFKVSIKGPLETPVGGGIRSLNVSIRQQLDLYACVRPIRYFNGVPSPLKEPQKTNMIIFRENSEDIYAGIEWAADSPEVEKVIHFLKTEMGVTKIRFPKHCGIGIKPVSQEGTTRLVREAILHAIAQDLESVTLVHKGNIMKFTEGGFREWGYQVAKEEFGAQLYQGGPWMSFKNPSTGKEIIIKDVIADAFLQQILLRPEDYSVIATLNLNGDYISDALAAQVGGIGIAPGANIGVEAAVFEATHGSAPKYAGQDKVNPGSIILSAEMMLRYMGWNEAADLIIHGMEGAIQSKQVTYDFARLMPGAHEIKCSEFADVIISKMK